MAKRSPDNLEAFFSLMATRVAETRAELLELAELYRVGDGRHIPCADHSFFPRLRVNVDGLIDFVHQLHESALTAPGPPPKKAAKR
jgi:hypothetical protein